MHAAQKIKKDLIHKAKVRKSYAKLKEREPYTTSKTFVSSSDPEDDTAATLELHPERQAMLESPTSKPPEEPNEPQRKPRSRKPKSVPFEKEARSAQRQKEEAEMRRRAIDDANEQRQRKLAERERFRKAMAKARIGGPNGQRKLGRESNLLLEKVQRVMGEQ